MSEQRYRSKPEARRSKPETRTTYTEEKRSKPERRREGRVLLGAGVTLLIGTVLSAALLIPPKTNIPAKGPTASPSVSASASLSPSASPKATPTATPAASADFQPPAKAPLVYETGGRVLLTSGGGRVSLGKVEDIYGRFKTMSAMLSGDNRFLYYITGLDADNGEGTLSAVSADGKQLPFAFAEGVCAANVSYDGESVMYVTGIKGAAGTLYAARSGKEELIAENVLPVHFKFSDSGEYMTYIVQEGPEAFALYVKESGGAPEIVTRMTASAVIDGGLSLSRLNSFVPLDNGQVLYSVQENYNMPLYLYTCGGGTERLCNDGYVVKTFSTGGFLYAETGREAKPLWYKAPGEEPMPVSDNYDYIIFPRDWPGAESAFLLVEHIGEGAEDTGVILYEAAPGGEKIAISLATGGAFEINNEDFDCAAYERDGKLYVSRRTEAGWKESFLADASVQETEGSFASGMTASFDESGKYLYYLGDKNPGPLYRYSVEDGTSAEIIDKADWFSLLGDVPFAHTVSDKLYRAADSPEMILEGVREIRRTQGGAYLLTGDGQVCFIAENENKARVLDSFSKVAEINGLIEFQPPLEQDAGAALSVLSGEIDYCLYKLGVFLDKYPDPLGVDKASALCGKLLSRKDIDEQRAALLGDMKAGFDAYTLWTRGKAQRSDAKSALEKAAKSYSDYAAGDSDE